MQAVHTCTLPLPRLLTFQYHTPISDHALIPLGIEVPPQRGEPRRGQHVLRRPVVRLEPRRNGKIAFGPLVVARHLPQAAAMIANPELVESELERAIIMPPRFLRVALQGVQALRDEIMHLAQLGTSSC